MSIAMPVEIGDEMTGFPLSNRWSLVFRQFAVGDAVGKMIEGFRLADLKW